MRDGDLTYDDFLQRLNIQDVLIDAGYRLNKRDGLRYPSYVRVDSEGKRVRGDKFIVMPNGKCCFKAQQQKVYNLISFIKEHPHFFTDYRVGVSPDHLVNLVCNRLLNHPIDERETRIIRPKQHVKPFDVADYEIHKFNPRDKENQKKFYPFFKHRGIDLYTQYAFHRDFCLATRQREDGLKYTNLAFPMTLPKDTGTVVGFEERGRPRMDGSGSYKGKAEGSNSSEGLWIANLKGPLSAVGGVAWFESGYDAMAFYQLNKEQIKSHPGLSSKSVYVSTGGTPTDGQIRGMLSVTPEAHHYLCFDNDVAGRGFVEKFKEIARQMNLPTDNIKVFPILPCYKDWNDALLGKPSPEYLKETEGQILPVEALHSGQEDENSRPNSYHR